jgi:hypothetical protein
MAQILNFNQNLPFDVLSNAVNAVNKLWKMKKIVKILIPLPIIHIMNKVMKICVLELVAIYHSFYTHLIYYFLNHLFFTRKLHVRDCRISSKTKRLLKLLILLNLGREGRIIEVDLPLGHFYFELIEKL